MPLTREDLEAIEALIRAAIAPLKNEIDALSHDVGEVKERIGGVEERIGGVEQQIGELSKKFDRMVAPDCDDLAKKITVAVKNSNRGTLGHGLLIQLAVDGEMKLAFLSAAHVLVFYQPDETVLLAWGDKQQQFRVKKKFLDKRYIEKGTHDIGLAIVELVTPENVTLCSQKVSCCSATKVGQVAVGHGLVYLAGRILLEEVDGSSRALIHAVSIPGCSGCPMFTAEELITGDGTVALHSLIHGSSKHRHSGIRLDDLTNHVYVDSMQLGTMKLQAVSTEEHIVEALKAAEIALDNPEMYSTEYSLQDSKCPEAVKNISKLLKFSADKKYSFNSAMEVLAGIALLEGPEVHLGVPDADSPVLQCMFPQSNVREKTETVVGEAKKIVTPIKH